MSAQKDNNGLGGASADTLPVNTAGKEGSASVPKAIIKNVDMSEEMQQISVDIALDALNKFTVEKDIAAHVKKTMDARFGPTWHAVVGQKYGSYVTHGEWARRGDAISKLDDECGLGLANQACSPLLHPSQC